MEALVSQVALTMLAAHDLNIHCIHLDTTSNRYREYLTENPIRF